MDLDDLAAAQNAVSTLLAQLPAELWSAATPCPEWDVAGVVRHLAVGERAFTTSLGGVAYELSVIAAEFADLSAADLSADDLPATYAAGAAHLREALAAAGDETFPTGIGPMPATAIAELRTIEAATHGWDVARGSGVTLELADDVAERAIAQGLALIDRLPPDRTPFGPPHPVTDDAPAIDRLAALLGRAV